MEKKKVQSALIGSRVISIHQILRMRGRKWSPILRVCGPSAPAGSLERREEEPPLRPTRP